MTVEAADVKARISLRALLERDGHVLKQNGADLVCLSPFGQEKTPSCHVHEKEGYLKCFSTGIGGDCFVYWQETRKVDFKAAMEALASIAGLSGGGPLLPPVVRPPKAEVVELASPLAGEDLERWTAAVARLKGSPAEQERIASWRGYDVATVRWMAETGMMGLVPCYGVMREAFVVERPAPRLMIPVSCHVRLGPNTPGNPHPKASWRYHPSGCGAWPFVIGDISTAAVVFACEGAWDVLALAQAMKWVGVGKLPRGVACVGMRGATSWKKFESFTWNKDAVLFAFPDRDAAGDKWFAPDGFLAAMKLRFSRVYPFRPMAASGKDLNDLLRIGGLNGEKLAAMFRRLILRRRGRGITFLAWCRAAAKTREDGIGRAARYVAADKGRPAGRRSRSRLEDWERSWERAGVAAELLADLRAAWAEWGKRP